jgi:hypothetical protein
MESSRLLESVYPLGYIYREGSLSISAFDPNSATTQVATTVESYRKAATLLAEALSEGSVVLDYGAGLGKGTHAMREVLNPLGIEVRSYEPFPERGETPDYQDPGEIDMQFDGIVNLNVLNVVEKEVRDLISKHIISLLSPTGVACIGTRSWSGDVNAAKNSEPADEENAIYVLRNQKGGNVVKVFQKGFNVGELANYIASFTNRPVTKAGNKFAACCVTVGPE